MVPLEGSVYSSGIKLVCASVVHYMIEPNLVMMFAFLLGTPVETVLVKYSLMGELI